MKGKGDHDLPVHRLSACRYEKTGRPLMKLVGIEQGGRTGQDCALLDKARPDYARNLCTRVGAMQRCSRIA